MSNPMQNTQAPKRSAGRWSRWLTSTHGVTAVATLIATITGLIVGMAQLGVIGGNGQAEDLVRGTLIAPINGASIAKPDRARPPVSHKLEFQTPSGNIGCSYGVERASGDATEYLRCEILSGLVTPAVRQPDCDSYGRRDGVYVLATGATEIVCGLNEAD
jgi:hypothetical protein